MNQWAYEHEGLSIVVSKSDLRATVTWKGVSDSQRPGDFLDPLIEGLAPQLKSAVVTVDLTGMEYLNSATIPPLIRLIRQLATNGDPVIVLFSNADWQQTHMRCTSVIARTLRNVSVETRPAG